MRCRHAAAGFAAAALLAALAAPAPAAEEKLAPLALRLCLRGAVFRADRGEAYRPALLVDLERSNSRWRRVWGLAGEFNVSVHHGRVVVADVGKDRIELKLSMVIRDDDWTRHLGGRGTYKVALRRGADGRLKGAYSGTFRGRAVSGEAFGRIKPPRRFVPGRSPARPGEHPRILFRAADVDRLRAKLRTPFGRAAAEKMTDAVGLAVRYRLTGDRALAAEARKRVEAHMADRSDGSKVERSRPWGKRLEKVSLAYDLCYDAWSDEFKREVERYLLWAAERMFYKRSQFDVHIHWHIASSYPGAILYGGALAGLALWGEKGPKPAEPPRPFADREPLAKIAGDADYKPPPGVPVSRFADDAMPKEWIYIGGFKPAAGADPLAALGGAAKARPALGTKLACGGRTEAFRPLSHEKNKGYYSDRRHTGGRTVIDITNAIGRVYNSTSCFYTVIDNDKPRWVRLLTDYDAAVAYLGGVKRRHGDYAHLAAGRHPLLVIAPIGTTKPWGRHLMQPRLAEASEKEARSAVAAIRAEHAERLADWRFDVDQWRRLRGADVRFLRLFEAGRYLMYLYYREGVGTGGFQAGSFSAMPMEGPNKYASCYRTMFAADASPYADVTHYVPRVMSTHVYAPRGRPFSQGINGRGGFLIDEYAERRDVSGGFLAALFPVIPEKWKPAALWAWQRHVGVTDAASAVKVLDRGHPAYAFVNYPLAMQPKHPSTCMPLTWRAPDHGFYAFRSAWAAGDEFVAQFFAKARPTGGVWQADNAATFRLYGLAQVWAPGPPFRLNRFRWMENVVLLPDDDTNRGACGRVTYVKTYSDGSGVVSVDLADVYASAQSVRRGPKGRERLVKQPLYERYGGVRRGESFRDSGIGGLRSFAVDYSGRCGAPCLLAIVDRITGGGRKVWVWQLGGIQMYGGERANLKPRRIDRGDLDRTTVAGSTFTIAKGEATLRGTFVAPAKVRLAAETRTRKGDVWFKRDKPAGRGIRMHSNGVFAEGGDSFFVVVTVGRGPPPAVKVKGAGLDAAVTVGKRTVRFDGHKIVLE